MFDNAIHLKYLMIIQSYNMDLLLFSSSYSIQFIGVSTWINGFHGGTQPILFGYFIINKTCLPIL